MRKLVYFVASTLDGFIAGPTREDPTSTVFEIEGDHAQPLMREYPEMIPAHLRPHLGMEGVENNHFDTVLEGRVSYVMALEQGVTNAYPHMRHYVFSTTLSEVPDPVIELVAGDPVAEIRELKQESGKDIWLCGGGALAGSLRDEIDEIHLKLNPVIVGSGAPLVDAGFQIDRYTLMSTTPFPGSGVVLLKYSRRV